MSSKSAFDLGQESGRRFKESTIEQLEAIANKLGVSTASLSTGDYSSGVGGYSRGMGTGKRGAGQRGGRRTGGGDHAAPERAYHGEPVLDEGTAADTDAAKAIREGFKNAQDAELRIPHAKGTEAEALSDAARDPNAARAAAVQAARDADDGFTGTASTYNPNKPGWKSGGQETASGERYSETAYTAAIQQQLAHQFWPEGKMGYGKGYQPRYFEAEDPKTGKKVIFKANDIMPFKGRSFNLNEATMKYLDPSMKKGVLSGLKFRPLPPGKEYQAGPVNEGERPASPMVANPAAARASASPAANTDDLAYLSERGAHSTTNRVEHPLGEDAGFNPELAARLAAAGRAYEAETGQKPTFGEGDRDIATQAHYWEDSAHGTKYRAARPGHSRHQSGSAMDIPYRDERGAFGRWLGAGTDKGRAAEFGLHYPMGISDRPHVEMDPRYKGDSFYNPNADPAKQQQQAAIGPNGEMIVFGGLGGQLDRESAARIAAAKGLTPKYFDYRDTEAALKYAKGIDRPYESMGFSAGVNSQERFAEEARKRGIQMPRGATAVGQYAPEGGRQKLPNNSGVPTEHYLDPSGKGLKGQVPEGNYFEGRHMPSKEDPGTMSRAADAIEARIKAQKSAAEKEVPEAAKNPAAAKAAEPKKEASTRIMKSEIFANN